MHGLAELVLSLCGLLEAEGRLLRENAFGLTRRCVLLVVGLLFGAGSLACLVRASYEAMLLVLSKPLAIALAGVLCALVAGFFLWCARGKDEKGTLAKQGKKEATSPDKPGREANSPGEPPAKKQRDSEPSASAKQNRENYRATPPNGVGQKRESEQGASENSRKLDEPAESAKSDSDPAKNT